MIPLRLPLEMHLEVSMNLKANLKVVLHANDVVVAESEDPSLWQRVLVAMSASGTDGSALADLETDKLPPLGADVEKATGGKTLQAFAKELGVDAAEVEGACGPSIDPPFIHLDKHNWEAFKKNTPERGAGAVNSTVLASTLLVLWNEHAKIGDVKLKDVTGVINTINLESKNPTRSVNNCEWLQLRNGVVKLNAARTSQAIAVAKAYCLKKPIDQE
jgi:hypothetical protein